MDKSSSKQVILSEIPLNEIMESVRSIVKEELKANQLAQLQEKLLSPAETCKIFTPPISKVTLSAWTKQGLLQEYRIGGRIYYKMSEVLQAGKSLQKYKRHIPSKQNSEVR
jgi:hypothetical protein